MILLNRMDFVFDRDSLKLDFLLYHLSPEVNSVIECFPTKLSVTVKISRELKSDTDIWLGSPRSISRPSKQHCSGKYDDN